jgi:hypothetical protein
LPGKDPYELFGIGLVTVRYWLQKGLGDQKVKDYNPITFQEEQDSDDLDR